jgi:GT2 family glycosyltransferase
MRPKLSIVIAVHDNWNFTKACLRDLAKLPDDHEVVLIDNGSKDKTRSLSEPDADLSEYHKNLYVVRLNENKGFAGGYNLGFGKSLGDCVLFLNNDVRVRGDFETWTEPLIKAAQEKRVLVGPTAGRLDADFNFVCESEKLPTHGYPYISGWNLTATRRVYQELMPVDHCGPFTTEFGPAYFEDTDLSMRARERSIELEVVPAPVHHFGKMTTKKLNTLSLYLPAKKKFIEKWKTRGKSLLLT